ncbi:hypothetical protein F5Y19DRAFT_272403 [Xylariaceae sp. FL1651]|nr:hypothetical protein F5Y19DRAFT_272403 [Xylariaceae sp. FL1651]
MNMSLIKQLCRSLQTPAVAKRYSDAGIGLVFIVFIQTLVIPIQITLDIHSINLPASILVMLLVATLMIISSCISGKVARFYDRYLRRPTDFLGRHMSFGFVAFFILLLRDHINSALDVPKLTGVFIVTTIMSYVGSFLFASRGFQLEQRIRRCKRKAGDLESNNKTWPSPSIAWPAPPTERCPKRISQLSSLNEAFSMNEPLASTKPVGDLMASTVDFVLRTAPVWVCLFLIIAIGVPVYFAADYVMPFEVFSFTLLWILSIQFQRYLRSYHCSAHFRRLRSLLIIFANPLLVTWVLGATYMWVKTVYTGKSIDIIIGEFRHYSSLSESVINIMRDSNVSAHLGAGDLAGLVLDAGVASMGFKMFEYRAELWASFGTVSFTCTALAAINVFLNVIVGHAFGLEAKEAIAFAGRSTTLALGVPAIENLGGSTTLMSAVAIFSGILFQMTADWLFSLMRINDRRVQQNRLSQSLKVSVPASTSTLFSSTATTVCDAEKKGSRRGWHRSPNRSDNCVGISEDSTVVAAGVTVGINAAAMGTAYLIERDSRATAYSALSMIMFGAATVALTALPEAAKTVVFLTSR